MRDPRRLARTSLPVFLAATLVSGCATTKVSDVARAPSPPTRPTAIVVNAVYHQTGNARRDEAGSRMAERIQGDLIQRLRKAGFETGASSQAPSASPAARLDISTRAMNKGNRLKRMVIGFGLGRASVAAQVRFTPEASPSPQLSFTGAAWTSSRPGLIVPVGVGLGTGSVGWAPVGVGTVLGLREGLNRAVARLDGTILEQLKRDYYLAGWAWSHKPAPNAGTTNG